MATSQNGWSVYTSPPSGTIPFITGRVRPEDVDTVFTYLCERIDAGVENIRPEWSWGWAYRAVRGQTSGFSNHASATAIDVNAPAHPLGVRGTWSPQQVQRIDAILRELQGVVRWGEHYSSRADGMHFEINASGEAVGRIAGLIRAGKLAGQQPAWKPSRAHAVHFGRVQEQFLIAAGVQKGKVTRNNGVGLLQKLLDRLYPDLGIVADGIVGERTLNAWGRFEKDFEGEGRPRVPGRKSIEVAAKKAGLDIVGEPWD